MTRDISGNMALLALGNGIAQAAEERRHQIEDLGYDASHDSQHASHELISAGMAYIERAWGELAGVSLDPTPCNWPQNWGEFLPKDNAFENMEIGIAFVAAGYDRLEAEIAEQDARAEEPTSDGVTKSQLRASIEAEQGVGHPGEITKSDLNGESSNE